MKQAPLIGCVLLQLAFAGVAHAQEATEPADYRPLIDRALSESRDAHWEEARALFRRAQALYPNARALRGLGMASFELRDYAECVRALREALAHAVQPLTAEQHTQVEGLLAQAALFVGSYSLVVPADVMLTIDERPLTREPDGTILLGLGVHRVRARSRDGRVVESAVDVQGGEQGPLPIDLARLASSAATPVEVDVSMTPPETTLDATPARASAEVPIALLVSGGALVVLGGVGLALGTVEADAVTSAPRATEWSEVSGAYERAPLLQGIGAAALGVGAVLAGVGGVLLATAPDASAQVQVHANGVSVRGVW